MFWQLSSLNNRYYCECAATARFPVDTQILWVRFDEVGIPGIFRYAEIIVALFSSRGLAEHMSYTAMSEQIRIDGQALLVGLRYFDARTKRPDILYERYRRVCRTIL